MMTTMNPKRMTSARRKNKFRGRADWLRRPTEPTSRQGFALRLNLSLALAKGAATALAIGSAETLVWGGDAQTLHFAVEVAALEAQGCGRLRHVPAVFL